MKYEVIRPWHGVKAGDVVELKQLHPALKTNVRPIQGGAAKLEPATPGGAPKKGDIIKRLKELEIEFDGRASADDLAALLPDGDPLKPTE
jgi:hypothetical protein